MRRSPIYLESGGVTLSTLLNNRPLILDKYLATLLGLNEALILQQVHYWLEINKKNNRNYHKDRHWTYNTIEEWQEEFPFWSAATVKRTFKKLRESKLIITDNFNLYQMDRTLWYTINYEELERRMIECGQDRKQTIPSTEGAPEDRKGQNNPTMGSNGIMDQEENVQMDQVKLTPPLPETSTEIASEISNPSIHLLRDDKRQKDRPRSVPHTVEAKYRQIIENCELCCIDEKYREAVGHAIKLLLLDIENCEGIKLGNIYIPVEMVEKDLHKLDFFVIEHAVSKFKEASARVVIKNTVAYLKSCIYRAIGETKIELDARLRYSGMIG